MPTLNRITPSPQLKRPFEAMNSGETAQMAQAVLEAYADLLTDDVKALLASTASTTRVKGLRLVRKQESRIIEQFCRDHLAEAVQYIRSHRFFGVLKAQNIMVPLELSSPDLTYDQLVGMANKLDNIERERDSIGAPKGQPSVHRGRRRRHRQSQVA